MFRHIIKIICELPYCWCCYGLFIIIVGLSCVGGTFGVSCCWCHYWFVMLLVLFLVRHVVSVDANVSYC